MALQAVQWNLLSHLIKHYGVDDVEDPFNQIILDQAFKVCHFEGLGEGLTQETLVSKLKIVEDRNLIRIYLCFLKGQTEFHQKRCPLGEHDLLSCPKLGFHEKLLQDLPELQNVCCLGKITDVATTAEKIRQHLERHGTPFIHTLYLRVNKEGKAPHLHDRYITIIPPEIKNFFTNKIDAYSNRLMLISHEIGEAVLGSSVNEYGSQGTLDIRYNRLKALPREARALCLAIPVPDFGPGDFRIILASEQKQEEIYDDNYR